MIKLAYQEVKEKHFLKALLYFVLFIGFTILYGLVRKMTSIHAL
jgi:type IV secretory pathway TrbL component